MKQAIILSGKGGTGKTATLTDRRQVFVETEELRDELAGLPPIAADYVTFSGTGEPTLAANLGEALAVVHQWPALKDVPTAVLTNATLLSQPEVRRDLACANLVVAKVDAPDEALFQTINRPIESVTWAKVVEGIRIFRQEFDGKIALQMMFIAANRDRAAQMAELAGRMRADEVQLNTPLRPSPTPPLSQAEMAEIEDAFAGLRAVSVYAALPPDVKPLDAAEMRRRRPVEGHPLTAPDEIAGMVGKEEMSGRREVSF